MDVVDKIKARADGDSRAPMPTCRVTPVIIRKATLESSK